MQLHAGESTSFPLTHARTAKEARWLNAVARKGVGKGTLKMRAQETVIQRNRVEYSFEKHENKILSEKQPIFFSKLTADT